MAIDEVVSFAWDIGVRDVVFETDSSMVTEALNGSTTPPVTIANSLLILNIDSRLQNDSSTARQAAKE